MWPAHIAVSNGKRLGVTEPDLTPGQTTQSPMLANK